ncbi:MAG: CBS domain-containing protein [Candidatus Pedobacter colombiensis]|uniref:CBS domain-containing protein n=1 Tax=Candidatus Pedobacter colombiensis TaxID=3121371 RepID=A0AAJ6B8W0_9SPHI|nr:CBS domain-containing protein [Pedobacter sp.]WEK20896.1 MAG: CBS domain-containing protein [Pedobacter sp.]
MISEELKQKMLIKTGLKTITPQDCATIANQITTSLNRYISTSTIKRIFGFAKTRFHFSKYTITTLELFVNDKSDIFLSTSPLSSIFISNDLPYLPTQNLEEDMKIGSVIAQDWFHPSPLENDHCLNPEQPVFMAIKIMTELQEESLPVYEHGKCIGIVYLKDLLYFIHTNDPDQRLLYHKLNFDLRSALTVLHNTMGHDNTQWKGLLENRFGNVQK